MGYEVKKILEWFLTPLGGSLVLLLAGLLLGRARRRGLGFAVALAGVAALVVFSMGVVAGALSAPLERRYHPLMPAAPLSGVAAVIVLGGGSEWVPGRPPTGWLQVAGLERLVEGVRVLRLAPGARLVVSGWGEPGEPSTAEVMAQAAVSLGVDASRIVRFDTTRDTADEIAALRKLVGTQKVVIVTSAEHMPRAMQLAAHAGLDAIAAPARVALGGAGRGWGGLVPSVFALERSTTAIHEWLGRLWASLVDAA
ncbi:MAG: YdcF family protein [Actinomycetota bacterium]|nr:YdcF family protein [Actinomycetota bacterium]